MSFRCAVCLSLVGLLACGDGDGGMPAVDGRAQCTTAADCDDRAFCNGSEVCDPDDPMADGRGCVAGPAPCLAGVTCDEDADLCGAGCETAPDADGDGEPSVACGGIDCDDTDPNVYPGNPEVCDVEGRDEDCDPTTFGFRDQDGDGYPDAACCNGSSCGSDCNDLQATVHPGEAESCDGLDNDCNGMVDDGLASQGTWYADCDGDLFGAAGMSLRACARPPGAPAACTDGEGTWVDDGTDCDDTRRGINPSAPEVCDGYDTDCNGAPDAPGEDDDGDGFGDSSCGGPDCSDRDDGIYPGAPEVCDGVDENCDGAGEDDDGDGFLALADACVGGRLADLPRTDCDDASENSFVGAPEICDGDDNDCDGAVDEGASAACLLDGARSACTAGACVFDGCLPGTADCDADPANGCDDLDWSGANCGGCGVSCAFACDGSGSCTDSIVRVDSMYGATCAVMSSGVIWCWGGNASGRLGDGTETDRWRPRRVQGLTNAVDVSVGRNHTCARRSDGTVWCWGRDTDGQLGNASTTSGSLVPVPVAGITGAVDLETGYGFSCALESGGQLCCWGDNADGELGTGDTTSRDTPACRATDYVEVELGQTFGCGRDAAGLLDCWGSNTSGQRQRAPSFPVTDFSLGHWHGCAIRSSDGQVYCWGDSREGQVGVRNNTHRNPTDMAVPGATQLSSGSNHACAMTSTGALWCWGRITSYGGSGSLSVATPRQIATPEPLATVVAGGDSLGEGLTCGLTAGGRLYCWGSNDDGELGIGSTVNQNTPQRVFSER